MTNYFIILFLTISIVLLSYHFNLLNKKLKHFKGKYGGIVDVELVIKQKESDLINMENKYLSLEKDYDNKFRFFELLNKEIKVHENTLDIFSCGLYNPIYDYNTSEKFKIKLEKIKEEQKELIKNESAFLISQQWTVNGSKVQGDKMLKERGKLMLRAFNGECDAIISKVNWNNVVNMENRIEKSYETINKLGSTNNITIFLGYKDLKIKELKLEFEYKEFIHKEKELERDNREKIREEEKVLKEFEKALIENNRNEYYYIKTLEKAKNEAKKLVGEQLKDLQNKIKDLEDKLVLSKYQKERIMSQAQLTKAGHVYIISNIGSFGENVFKIGMTRRLDPMDRVIELGGASVPFKFDVHAVVYSENAPELERLLHKKFEDKRVNLINGRKEFFNVSIHEIEKVMLDLKLKFNIVKLFEAKEYRESKSKMLSVNDNVNKYQKF